MQVTRLPDDSEIRIGNELAEAYLSTEPAQPAELHTIEKYVSGVGDQPGEIEEGLDPEQIAKMLGESLRQHFLRSGVQGTVIALQTTSAAMTSAQKELSAALRTLSNSRGGVVAQMERANQRVEYSLDSRAKTMDAHLHEWKSDLLRIWIPMIAGASLLVGMFDGMDIQGCRDAASPVSPPQSAGPAVSTPQPTASDRAVESRNQQVRSHERANASVHRGR